MTRYERRRVAIDGAVTTRALEGVLRFLFISAIDRLVVFL
jgi:hypothetical protein